MANAPDMGKKKEKGILDFFMEDDSKKSTLAPQASQPQEDNTPADKQNVQSVTLSKDVDSKIYNMLKDLLKSKDNKCDGFEYTQFKDVLDELATTIPDENTRFAAAMATVKSMKSNPDILITTAKSYIKVLNDEADNSAKAIKAKLDTISEQETDIATKQTEIDKLIDEKKTLETKVNKNKKNIVETQNAYNIASQALIADISVDVAKIKKFVK